MEVVIESGLADRDRHRAQRRRTATTRCPATAPCSTPSATGTRTAAETRHARPARPGRRATSTGASRPATTPRGRRRQVKIARIETFLVPPRWLFCRVETDDGLVGWGEPVVEGRAEVVRAAVEVLAEYLDRPGPAAHRGPLAGAHQGRLLPGRPGALQRRRRPRPGAVGHRRARRYGAPVHALLGGPVRDRVRVYAWVGGDEPGELGRRRSPRRSRPASPRSR